MFVCVLFLCRPRICNSTNPCETLQCNEASNACDIVIPKDCSVFDSQCTEGRCNPSNGQCFAANIRENQACDDGRFCTSNTGKASAEMTRFLVGLLVMVAQQLYNAACSCGHVVLESSAHEMQVRAWPKPWVGGQPIDPKLPLIWAHSMQTWVCKGVWQRTSRMLHVSGSTQLTAKHFIPRKLSEVGCLCCVCSCLLLPPLLLLLLLLQCVRRAHAQVVPSHPARQQPSVRLQCVMR